MRLLTLGLFLFSSSLSLASENDFFLIDPSDKAQGCEYSLLQELKDGSKVVHINYPNHPIKKAKISLEECISNSLEMSSLNGEGLSIEIQHKSLGDTKLEILVKHKEQTHN